MPKKSIRGKLTSTASPLRSSSSLFVDKMETGAVEADLTTETWRRVGGRGWSGKREWGEVGGNLQQTI